MNILRKLYCRAFQTAFRIALPFFPYRNPQILNHMEEITKVLDQHEKKHPLIVTDQTLSGLGATKELEALLRAKNIPFSLYDGTLQNPTAKMVEEAFQIFQTAKCDALISFGGGSPMDLAKAVGARAAYPNKPLKAMAGILRVRRKIPLLIAIPTTAGTGSETTLAAVIVDDETRHKYMINSFPLIPSYTILDSSVTRSLPHAVAAATGMDALTHAVEAYIGRSTTKETRADALTAVKLIFANIEAAAEQKSDTSRENMLLAAHLAGRAFTRSYVGYIHAVSHSLSGKYNMPHGLTNAVLLPIVLDMYGQSVHKKLARLAAAAGIGNTGDSEEEVAKKFISAIYGLNKRLGIPGHLEGIEEKDLDLLAAYADQEANPLYPVPVLWNANELKRIYRKAANIHGQSYVA